MSEDTKKAPDIRFQGFTDDWEQRKLGSIYQFQYGHFNNNPDNGGIYPIYGANGIIGGYHGFNAENSVVIGHMGAYAGHVLWVEGKHFVTYNGTIGFPKDLNFDRKFGFHMLQHINIPKITAGSGQPFVSYSDLENIKLYISDSIDEQNKLGYFFDMLENTIALHQRKVTLLKRLKEAYLTRMLPQNSENIPLLRFADYFDPWEQRKFEDLAESFNYGLNASAMEFDGENKYIRITDIDEYSHRFIQSGLTSPNTDLSNANDYLLKEGDILFARTGASVGKSYQYEPLDGKVYYAGFLIRARIKPDFDSSFIFQNTLTEKYNNFIKITSQRSGQPGVNAQEYANFSIMVPSRGEQVKLGNFFKQLDNAIALHQCKIEKLAKAKKVLLAAMFV